ncbi:hypothetical protein B9Q22_20325 [Enterobacter roggenkampii]|nr:hypothetical protein B9Q25_22145 [Enterobacter roggenkampii]PJD14874.1 hypothetical protein B9Q21_22025 [Enterobacter roggenkampii]PJD17148.1 hypothetical protein B9Q22_20325 [Enterobacter roggenkampii]
MNLVLKEGQKPYILLCLVFLLIAIIVLPAQFRWAKNVQEILMLYTFRLQLTAIKKAGQFPDPLFCRL